ncbi:MAG: hypothetical protein Harvfovirus3_45 [Harvfovirus sp.]|uniref:Uncharacterized protein n=1 Tax=Harvfovirus sp. TaxID=2487768 RepID=A0A3G5A0E4_9VIRU|nr:MAG: hypothetical protein Harvfovirus3_45 [Harvfovirus sp.]
MGCLCFNLYYKSGAMALTVRALFDLTSHDEVVKAIKIINRNYKVPGTQWFEFVKTFDSEEYRKLTESKMSILIEPYSEIPIDEFQMDRWPNVSKSDDEFWGHETGFDVSGNWNEIPEPEIIGCCIMSCCWINTLDATVAADDLKKYGATRIISEIITDALCNGYSFSLGVPKSHPMFEGKCLSKAGKRRIRAKNAKSRVNKELKC